MTHVADVMNELRALSSEANRAGMARFGINTAHALGVSVTTLRKLGRPYRKDHALALALWKSGVHEARMLAAIIDDPAQVTARQMDQWAREFDSWDICDGCCTGLFDLTPFAYDKARQWSSRKEEYMRRGAFALIAGLAVHDKQATDAAFLALLPLIKAAATDDRNFVKKAVNWALRNIGKRNARLNKAAVAAAREMARMDSKAAHWIASDALRELTADKTLARIKKKQ
ncbi:MAG: DNA alkylation repair protein [Chloroflexi bacterium]|nr:DNA alkylation repair protein [Chloroflexota bacterium]